MSEEQGPLKAVPRPKVHGPPPFRKAKILSAIGATTILAFHAVPHLFPQLNKNLFELKIKSGIPQRVKDIYLETCNKMGVKSPRDCDLFYNSGFLTVSAGSFSLPNKAVIGLPRSFSTEGANVLRKSKVQFDSVELKWDSACGRALEKALEFKSDHVAFAIAHEMVHIKNYDFVYRGFLPAAWFYGTCRGIIWILPRAQNAPTKGYKLLLTILLAGISYACFREANDYMKRQLELRADEQAAECGLNYCDGGISYLNSHLRINRVIRHMSGISGVQRYTEKGDDVYNTSHPLLTERINRLKEIRQKFVPEANDEN